MISILVYHSFFFLPSGWSTTPIIITIITITSALMTPPRVSSRLLDHHQRFSLFDLFPILRQYLHHSHGPPSRGLDIETRLVRLDDNRNVTLRRRERNTVKDAADAPQARGK